MREQSLKWWHNLDDKIKAALAKQYKPNLPLAAVDKSGHTIEMIYRIVEKQK